MWIQLMRPKSNIKIQNTDHKMKSSSTSDICTRNWVHRFPLQELEMVAEDLDLFDNPLHGDENGLKVLTSEDMVLSNALPGDFIRFMTTVGGGGCQELLTKEFSVLIQLSPNEKY